MSSPLLLLVFAPLLALAVGTALLAAVLAWTGARARPAGTADAAAAAARRHQLTTGVLALVGGLVVAAAAASLAPTALLSVTGVPGLVAALAPYGAALVLLAVHAAGELTWPRPRGAVRSAVLVHRSLRDLTGARAWLLAGTSAVTVALLVAFGATAADDGRMVANHLTAAEIAAGISGLRGPYPGWPYGGPALVALGLVLLSTLAVLHLVARRAAVGGADREVDHALRLASVRRVLGGVQLLVGAALTGYAVVGGISLYGAGWQGAALTCLGVAVVSLVVSFGALLSSLRPVRA
ncbi:hypothetical protein FE374_16050 [Georgenia yuyongxinii]|uniref:Uncharacterized protein n=1 Tax=Georgenia yuyongxinii TaxID=2589797 RepID=A0A5B8C8V1_9MICO|nr:hypothetical protein [Georgenia yuyongxinii]QDC25931.1 hypothetical protein FE374_16050 [Georgenia yuyongxinii]